MHYQVLGQLYPVVPARHRPPPSAPPVRLYHAASSQVSCPLSDCSCRLWLEFSCLCWILLGTLLPVLVAGAAPQSPCCARNRVLFCPWKARSRGGVNIPHHVLIRIQVDPATSCHEATNPFLAFCHSSPSFSPQSPVRHANAVWWEHGCCTRWPLEPSRVAPVCFTGSVASVRNSLWATGGLTVACCGVWLVLPAASRATSAPLWVERCGRSGVGGLGGAFWRRFWRHLAYNRSFPGDRSGVGVAFLGLR